MTISNLNIQECRETNPLVEKISSPTLKAIFKNKDHPSLSPNKEIFDKGVSIFKIRPWSILFLHPNIPAF